MTLIELLAAPPAAGQDVEVGGLALDSREVQPGDLFIALAGASRHGMQHAEQAVARGAVAVLYDPAGDGADLAAKITGVPVLAVADLSGRLGEQAARFYREPSQALTVIGITGTNGKTSCAQFLSQLLPACGIIGTLGWGEWGKLNKTLNTTPDALAVQKILAELRAQGKQAAAMEVSSHGIEQGRVNGVHFHGAVFTNISRDHLDYHGTMAVYVAAKLALLRQPGLAFAVVNLDDEYSAQILAAVPENVALWGHSRQGKTVASGETLSAEHVLHGEHGIAFDVCWRAQRATVHTLLFGDFNIDNGLSVLAVLLALGEPLDAAAGKLAALMPVPGRMERFGGDGLPRVFVDYAHTPDALDKVLAGVRKHCGHALWAVFGCGGNRDRGKRPEMGAAAVRWADRVIVTDDNPRHEDGQDIVNDILLGCGDRQVRVIRDRRRAIGIAISEAGAHDWIVVAGKGHEDYQEIAGVRYPFSDAETVRRTLDLRASGGHAAE